MSIARVLVAWVSLSRRHPRRVLIAGVALALACIFYTRDNLTVNTDTADMISTDLEWRRTYIAFKEAFPQYVDTLLIVVDGETPEIADRAGRSLAAAVAAERTLVEWVVQPDALPLFERNALLYATHEELNALSSRLAEVQPFLGTLAAEPNLTGIATLLESVSTASESDLKRLDLSPLFDALANAADAERNGERFEVSWRTLLLGERGESGATRRFVIVKPKLDYRELLPAGPIITQVRTLVRELELVTDNGVRVRVTGAVALAHEELESVARGAAVAGILALVMVSAVLVIGLGSWRLVLATLGTLLIGLSWTAGFATVAIGSLNLISVAFAVLYISLGIDYAVHLSLRYRELVNQGLAHGAALDTATGDVGVSLALCAITTGGGFYAFVPTEFAGISELGIISGTGMFISFVATLTLLPALLTIMPLTPRRAAPGEVWSRSRSASSPRWAMVLRRFRLPVITLTVVLGFGALATAPAARFDDNPLNLQDQTTESVTTYRDLLATGDTSPWDLTVLVSGFSPAEQLAQRLEALETVREVRWLGTLIAQDQPAKLERIEDLALLLGPEFEGATPSPGPGTDAPRAGFDRLHRAVRAIATRAPPPPGASRAQSALDALGLDGDDQALRSFEHRFTGTLPEQIARLSRLLDAESVTAASIPPQLREWWVTGDGRYRLEIRPHESIESHPARVRFITSVQRVAPAATGTPLVILRSGESVVRAFLQAFTWAFILVTVLLMLLLKHKRDGALVMGLLLLAGAVTAATMTGLDIAFNFANIIALPLLLGIGADNGIHMVVRAREVTGQGDVLMTSTTRAVLVSALTTICGFGNLAFSSHLGVASMGTILTIGLIVTLVCTLIILPVIMTANDSQMAR